LGWWTFCATSVIGANSAMFSGIDAVLLQLLPFSGTFTTGG
jgi:hypothetical protein